MNFLIPGFFLISALDVSNVDFDALLTICVERNHECYREAWIEFERRYRKTILARIRKYLTRWNKSNDVAIVKDISSLVSLRLIKNDFRALRTFRGRKTEGKFFQFLNVICRNCAYVYMINYVNENEGLSDSQLQEYLTHHPKVAEDLFDALINKLRTALSGTHKSAYYIERDIFVFLLRIFCGFQAKEVEQIPLLGITHGNVENVITRVSNLLNRLS